MTSRVVVIGDVMLDVVVRPLTAFAPTSDTASHIRVGRGGSAASVALAIARSGHDVRYLGAAGPDGSAGLIRAALERGGVRADFESVDAPTGTVVSVVGENGQRAMLTDRGANSLLSETFVLQSLVAPFDHVHVSGYLFLDASTRRVARAALVCAIESARSVSVDVCSVGPLAQITPEAFLHGAQGATYLFANEEEALALTSRATVGNALDFLADRFDEVMITRGSQGALAARGAERYDVRAHQVRVLDTTGAGDAATGAYLGARLDALSIGSSMDNAMTGAARVVGDLGAN